jgi:hypothetical protein
MNARIIAVAAIAGILLIFLLYSHIFCWVLKDIRSENADLFSKINVKW